MMVGTIVTAVASIVEVPVVISSTPCYKNGWLLKNNQSKFSPWSKKYVTLHYGKLSYYDKQIDINIDEFNDHHMINGWKVRVLFNCCIQIIYIFKMHFNFFIRCFNNNYY